MKNDKWTAEFRVSHPRSASPLWNWAIQGLHDSWIVRGVQTNTKYRGPWRFGDWRHPGAGLKLETSCSHPEDGTSTSVGILCGEMSIPVANHFVDSHTHTNQTKWPAQWNSMNLQRSWWGLPLGHSDCCTIKGENLWEPWQVWLGPFFGNTHAHHISIIPVITGYSTKCCQRLPFDTVLVINSHSIKNFNSSFRV